MYICVCVCVCVCVCWVCVRVFKLSLRSPDYSWHRNFVPAVVRMKQFYLMLLHTGLHKASPTWDREECNRGWQMVKSSLTYENSFRSWLRNTFTVLYLWRWSVTLFTPSLFFSPFWNRSVNLELSEHVRSTADQYFYWFHGSGKKKTANNTYLSTPRTYVFVFPLPSYSHFQK